MVITPQMVVIVLSILWQIIQKLMQVAATGTPADITAELDSLKSLKLRTAAEIEAEADLISKTEP